MLSAGYGGFNGTSRKDPLTSFIEGTSKMKRIVILLSVIFTIHLSSVLAASEEFTFDKRDAKELSKLMKSFFDARLEDKLEDKFEAKEKIADLIEQIQEKQGIGDLLKFVDAWNTIREGTIDDTNMVFKTKSGDFKPGEYTDMGDYSQRKYMYYISVPKE